MPIAKCVMRCWDSQATKRYWPGDQDEMSPEHPFIKAGCFVFLQPFDQKQLFADPMDIKPQPLPELVNPQNKRRGNPNWHKKEVSP